MWRLGRAWPRRGGGRVGCGGLRCVWRWRREQPEFDAVLRMVFAACRTLKNSGFRVAEVLSEEICAAIVEGGSFASLSREGGGPSRATLRHWYRADPAFAAQVDWACEA